MTLDEAARHFRWDPTHDYSCEESEGDRIVAIRGLGIWETDLRALKEMIPGLMITERRRVEHDHDDWLRVDLREGQ